MTTLYIIVAAVGYLLGSIPFGYLLVKIFRGEDVRLSGSGNIGATNVARSGAKGLGIATLVLDALKGSCAVGFALLLAPRQGFHGIGPPSPLPLMATAALAAVLGHVFPAWLRFKGGKGVATALGVFVVLFPKAILLALAIFILVVAVTRYVSLGSVLGAIAFPIAAYFLQPTAPAQPTDWVSLALASTVSLIVIFKHRENMRRLLTGNENRLGSGKPAEEKQA